jgi:hypothetical protein
LYSRRIEERERGLDRDATEPLVTFHALHLAKNGNTSSDLIDMMQTILINVFLVINVLPIVVSTKVKAIHVTMHASD